MFLSGYSAADGWWAYCSRWKSAASARGSSLFSLLDRGLLLEAFLMVAGSMVVVKSLTKC